MAKAIFNLLVLGLEKKKKNIKKKKNTVHPGEGTDWSEG